ncbi:MAG: lipopolysaccharide assembly protein LapA domain-containing protein [Povalibacter sp.]
MNAHPVEIELAFARLKSPLGVALVIAFTAGLLAGLAVRVYWVAELLAERGRLRRALRLAEANARSNALAADKKTDAKAA